MENAEDEGECGKLRELLSAAAQHPAAHPPPYMAESDSDHHLHKRRLWLKVDKGLAKLLARSLLEPSMPPLPSSVSTSVKGLAVDLSIPSYMGYCIYVFWSGKWESSTAPRGILCVAHTPTLCSH
ncbi:hypothetical protein NC651_033548 [Populus alba x Populus x berolinensis]|nr:hypothetical protein NC651_033548 [Populus alba x Populus x berolinensis]